MNSSKDNDRKIPPKGVYKEHKVLPAYSKLLLSKWEFNSSPKYPGNIEFNLIPDFTSSMVYISYASKYKNKVFAYGPNRSRIAFKTDVPVSILGFRFRPMIFSAVSGIPAVTTSGGLEMLDEILTPEKISLGSAIKQIFSSDSLESFRQNTEEFIDEFVTKHLDVDPDLIDAVDKLLSSDGKYRLKDTLTDYSGKQRQFQRKFRMATGLSAKEFTGLVRIHNAAHQLVKSGYRHFDVLVDSGFYDQSHYYREFKKLFGMLPTYFASKQKYISHIDLD